MIPVQVRITKKIMEEIDILVDKGIYSNRSEVIRDATRRHVMSMAGGR
jgi:Arc/MetJ-type ribon-helix-helix transcriptional regulator